MQQTKKTTMSGLKNKTKTGAPKVPDYWRDLIEVEENRSACICRDNNDYCRCTTISPEVLSIDYIEIIRQISNSSLLSPIQVYCLDRWIRLAIATDDIEACGKSDYYGEILCVELCDDTKTKFQDYLDKLYSNTPEQNIEYVLELEYGHVLDSIKNKEWIFKIVDIDTIQGSAKLLREHKNVYTGTETILCQTIGKNQYRIIDGNHRFTAAIRSKQTKISIITTKK
jgi:hypothetical protein